MKKLATLEVYLDDTPGDESSHINFEDESTYRLYLRPQSDVVNGIKPRPEIVLAHELGHFVAKVVKTDLGVISGDAFTTLAEQNEAEKEAWHIADAIIPGASKTPEAKVVLANYARNARKAPDMPNFLLNL